MPTPIEQLIEEASSAGLADVARVRAAYQAGLAAQAQLTPAPAPAPPAPAPPSPAPQPTTQPEPATRPWRGPTGKGQRMGIGITVAKGRAAMFSILTQPNILAGWITLDNPDTRAALRGVNRLVDAVANGWVHDRATHEPALAAMQAVRDMADLVAFDARVLTSEPTLIAEWDAARADIKAKMA